MRSSEEIFRKSIIEVGWPEDTFEAIKSTNKTQYNIAINAIRQAQLEAIEECAKDAAVSIFRLDEVDFDTVEGTAAAAEKISNNILQLKNQVR